MPESLSPHIARTCPAQNDSQAKLGTLQGLAQQCTLRALRKSEFPFNPRQPAARSLHDVLAEVLVPLPY